MYLLFINIKCKSRHLLNLYAEPKSCVHNSLVMVLMEGQQPMIPNGPKVGGPPCSFVSFYYFYF